MKWYTVREAADYLGLSYRGVYAQIRNGAITAAKLGKLLYISESGVLNYEADHLGRRGPRQPLFRQFKRAARGSFHPEAVEQVFSSDGRYGYRRQALINNKKVELRKATRRPDFDTKTSKAYQLHLSLTICDYIFYSLDRKNFLFMPKSGIPSTNIVFIDSERSKYHRFRNNFSALPRA